MDEAESLIVCLPPKLFKDLCDLLDENDCWQKIMAVCPSIWYTCDDQRRFKKNKSPSSALLNDLSRKSVTLNLFEKLLRFLHLERPLELIIEDEPVHIIVQPPKAIDLDDSHSELIISFEANGFPFPQYEWYKGCGDNKWELITGTQEPTLSIAPDQKCLQGIYICNVWNRCSSKLTCPVEVTVMKADNDYDIIKSKLRIITQPMCPSMVEAGCSVKLDINVEGATPQIYQWYKNGVPLKGANSSELTLHRVQPENDNNILTFVCSVKNYCGDVLSDPAIMTVNTRSKRARYYAKAKKALIFGNTSYAFLKLLKSAKDDAESFALALEKLQFEVTVKLDCNHSQMEEAIAEFCKNIVAGSYVVFYFAGHGFALNHQAYMQPIDAQDYKIEKCVCAEELQVKLQQHVPALCFLMFDMCRRNPERDEDIEKQWKMVNVTAPPNSIVMYATVETKAAYESPAHKNGFLMQHLLQFVEKDICIKQMADEVQESLGHDNHLAGKQNIEIKSTLVHKRCLTDPIDNYTQP